VGTSAGETVVGVHWVGLICFIVRYL